MIQEPKLLETQVAVLSVDRATGHVLTTNGDVYLSDSSLVYFIFDTINLAREHIKQVQEKNNTLDFTVYDSNYKLVEFAPLLVFN